MSCLKTASPHSSLRATGPSRTWEEIHVYTDRAYGAFSGKGGGYTHCPTDAEVVYKETRVRAHVHEQHALRHAVAPGRLDPDPQGSRVVPCRRHVQRHLPAARWTGISSASSRGAQKNVGIAGISIVVVRDLLKPVRKTAPHVELRSSGATKAGTTRRPCFRLHVQSGLQLDPAPGGVGTLLKAQPGQGAGGLRRAGSIEVLQGPRARIRNLMNILFHAKRRLDDLFVEEARKARMDQIRATATPAACGRACTTPSARGRGARPFHEGIRAPARLVVPVAGARTQRRGMLSLSITGFGKEPRDAIAEAAGIFAPLGEPRLQLDATMAGIRPRARSVRATRSAALLRRSGVFCSGLDIADPGGTFRIRAGGSCAVGGGGGGGTSGRARHAGSRGLAGSLHDAAGKARGGSGRGSFEAARDRAVLIADLSAPGSTVLRSARGWTAWAIVAGRRSGSAAAAVRWRSGFAIGTARSAYLGTGEAGWTLGTSRRRSFGEQPSAAVIVDVAG